MLDVNEKLRGNFTFEELIVVIQDDHEFRGQLIRALAENHGDEIRAHLAGGSGSTTAG